MTKHKEFPKVLDEALSDFFAGEQTAFGVKREILSAHKAAIRFSIQEFAEKIRRTCLEQGMFWMEEKIRDFSEEVS
jgi:hypothetical protein